MKNISIVLGFCKDATKVRSIRGSTRNYATKASVVDGSSKVLVTGSLGQIGTELIPVLRKKYGQNNVIATDVRKAPQDFAPFQYLDVLDANSLSRLVVEHRIDLLIHNTGILSAAGERNPKLAMDINVLGVQNALEVARQHNLKVFIPSSIAAFGLSSPKVKTPDLTIMRPSTIYGVTKVYAELLGEYYFSKYGVDFRSIRYPGVISNKALPGGGTTDYAVEIFYEALKTGEYNCFLSADSELPMMYMPDCIKSTIDLIEAPAKDLQSRTYNVTAFSFTPAQLAKSIQKFIPKFTISYKPDFRQAIADSWPKSLDDSGAKKDWKWKPDFDLDAMTKDMLIQLRAKLQSENPKATLQSLKL